MDYEKKYNEALERAKMFKSPYCQHAAEVIFPELCESEDERIRKELLEHCINRRDGKQICVDASDYKRWAAWLEKQGEQAAEWQKQRMKEALQTEYEKGRFDMREEMIKDAVEGEIGDIMPLIEVSEMNNYLNYVKAHGLKTGDKVKVIIVRED